MLTGEVEPSQAEEMSEYEMRMKLGGNILINSTEFRDAVQDCVHETLKQNEMQFLTYFQTMFSASRDSADRFFAG